MPLHHTMIDVLIIHIIRKRVRRNRCTINKTQEVPKKKEKKKSRATSTLQQPRCILFAKLTNRASIYIFSAASLRGDSGCRSRSWKAIFIRNGEFNYESNRAGVHNTGTIRGRWTAYIFLFYFFLFSYFKDLTTIIIDLKNNRLVIKRGFNSALKKVRILRFVIRIASRGSCWIRNLVWNLVRKKKPTRKVFFFFFLILEFQ
ncbi:hypothetical protein PUN28_019050 [Cardiocondyla obscurior]|uniref:Ribosomal protein S11 n=1 Tax=Cardiocondyla obscurior TaxID=286306 RepID=A0AAW2EF79_9HYME